MVYARSVFESEDGVYDVQVDGVERFLIDGSVYFANPFGQMVKLSNGLHTISVYTIRNHNNDNYNDDEYINLFICQY